MLAERKLDQLFSPEKKEYILKKRKLSRQIKIAASGLIFGMFLIQLLFAFKYASVLVSGQDLIAKQQELKKLQIKNQQLHGEVKRLQSLDRIEAIATTELGMTVPKDTARTSVSLDTFSN